MFEAARGIHVWLLFDAYEVVSADRVTFLVGHGLAKHVLHARDQIASGAGADVEHPGRLTQSGDQGEQLGDMPRGQHDPEGLFVSPSVF